jgi:hypothetical protein
MSERREIEAFFNFFATFNLARPVSAVQDLADGAALFEVLSLVYVGRPISTKFILLTHRLLVMRATFASPPDPLLNRQKTGFSDSVPSNASTVS